MPETRHDAKQGTVRTGGMVVPPAGASVRNEGVWADARLHAFIRLHLDGCVSIHAPAASGPKTRSSASTG
jgi:hypothetical protein